jgi:hypothetical protein
MWRAHRPPSQHPGWRVKGALQRLAGLPSSDHAKSAAVKTSGQPQPMAATYVFVKKRGMESANVT